MGNDLIQSAVIRQIEVIGEAASLISTEFCVDHPEIPWRKMVDMRNRLIHGYSRVRLDLVWQAVRDDIPSLIALIEPLTPLEED